MAEVKIIPSRDPEVYDEVIITADTEEEVLYHWNILLASRHTERMLSRGEPFAYRNPYPGTPEIRYCKMGWVAAKEGTPS